MIWLALGFYYAGEPVSISAIVDIAIGIHHVRVNGQTHAERALIVHAYDDQQKLRAQAFVLDQIGEDLRLSLRDD